MTLSTVVVGIACWFAAGFLLAWLLGRHSRHQALKAKRLRRSLHRYLRARDVGNRETIIQAVWRSVDRIEADKLIGEATSPVDEFRDVRTMWDNYEEGE